MSRQKILRSIRLCARKLKRNPGLRDLRLLAGISEQVLYKRFGSLRRALEAAGLQPSGPGIGQQESTLLLDWASVARKLGKLPSVHEYENSGRFSNMPFHSRYTHWTRIPDAFRRFASEQDLESKWKDVLRLIAARNPTQRMPAKPRSPMRVRKGPIHQDRPIYGAPLMNVPELAYEPLTESGVIFAFALVARRLGFIALRFQTAFPDCEAMREVARGVWQRVRIEIEVDSRSFLKHRHKKNGCDILVCWRHNWPDCPRNIEVIELSKLLGQM
jgi:HNH endonuclease